MSEAIQDPVMQIAEINLDAIRESPTNPRKTFDKRQLDELAEDVRTRGVLQPILVREQRPGRFEIIVGARRFRASKAADRKTIPAIVTEMEDLEVLETQIVENAKRADVPPLEEAEGYQALMQNHGLTADEVAAKVNRSRSAVYARLKLCELGEPAKKALREGKLTASTAELDARIPVPALQKQAVEEIGGNDWNEPMSFRAASEVIQDRYMLRLGDAAWELDDADLVAKAGPCTTCPKRTGNQRELFGDVKSPDVCTDPKCYDAKNEAHGNRLMKAAKAAGQTVISGKEANKLVSRDGRLYYGNRDYINPDEECTDDPKFRKWRRLVGKKHAPEPVLVRAESGAIVQVWRAKEARAALKAAGHTFKRRASPTTRVSQSESAFEKRRRLTGVVQSRATAAVVEASGAENHLGDPRILRLVARAFVREMWHETLKQVARRRGLEPEKKGRARAKRPDELLKDWIRTAGELELQGLILEFVVARDGEFGGYTPNPRPGAELLEASEIFDVDVKAIEKELKSGLSKLARAAARKKAAKKKGAKRKAAKKKASAKKASRKKSAKRKAARRKA